MKSFEQTLQKLTEYIQAYDDTSQNDGETLNYLLKKISVTLAYLNTEMANYKKLYELRVFDLTTNKKLTVARAINFAEVDYPEVYLLRKVITSGERVADAIRTNISFLKNERNNSR